jgi:hypothetical protein
MLCCAVQYAEGMVFKVYLLEGRILRSTELGPLVNTDEYLSGVLDFTGELNRYAVARATARDVGAVQRARDVVDALQGQFLQMDLRNGSLRCVGAAAAALSTCRAQHMRRTSAAVGCACAGNRP